MDRTAIRIVLSVLLCAPAFGALRAEQQQLTLRVSWGHRAASRGACLVRVVPAAATIERIEPATLEPGEDLEGGIWRTQAGGGDVTGWI